MKKTLRALFLVTSIADGLACICFTSGSYCQYTNDLPYPHTGVCHGTSTACSCDGCPDTNACSDAPTPPPTPNPTPTPTPAPTPTPTQDLVVPVGHAVYTYEKNPWGAIEAFNTRSGGGANISIVNVYGGWFVKNIKHTNMNCSDTHVPGAEKVFVTITNNDLQGRSVVVLGCKYDHCSASTHPYVKCPRAIPAGADAVVELASDLHFLIFDFGGSDDDVECWPKTYGSFPSNLTLTGADIAAQCAAEPRPLGPGPAPTPDTFALALEPAASSSTAAGSTASNFTAWAAVPGVEHVVAVLDGRMDLCVEYAQYNLSGMDCSWAPDLQPVSGASLDATAALIAQTFCAIDALAGLQVDLEPFAPPYQASLTRFMGAIAAALRSDVCIDARHPHGRFLSLFAFAESFTGGGRALLGALGPNGFVAISGYDLYADDADSRFNGVAEYKAKLTRQVDATRRIVGGAGLPWALGIPMAASAHEYEAYVPSQWHCGPACKQYNNTATMTDYIEAALEVVAADPAAFALDGSNGFRGLTLWQWPGPNAAAGDYPKGSGNMWYPANPSSRTLDVLKKGMPLLPHAVQHA